jgi:hypothetical protein
MQNTDNIPTGESHAAARARVRAQAIQAAIKRRAAAASISGDEENSAEQFPKTRKARARRAPARFEEYNRTSKGDGQPEEFQDIHEDAPPGSGIDSPPVATLDQSFASPPQVEQPMPRNTTSREAWCIDRICTTQNGGENPRQVPTVYNHQPDFHTMTYRRPDGGWKRSAVKPR